MQFFCQYKPRMTSGLRNTTLKTLKRGCKCPLLCRIYGTSGHTKELGRSSRAAPAAQRPPESFQLAGNTGAEPARRGHDAPRGFGIAASDVLIVPRAQLPPRDPPGRGNPGETGTRPGSVTAGSPGAPALLRAAPARSKPRLPQPAPLPPRGARSGAAPLPPPAGRTPGLPREPGPQATHGPGHRPGHRSAPAPPARSRRRSRPHSPPGAPLPPPQVSLAGPGPHFRLYPFRFRIRPPLPPAARRPQAAGRANQKRHAPPPGLRPSPGLTVSREPGGGTSACARRGGRWEL